MRTSGARDAVIDRYSGLARTALAGGAPVDCEPDASLTGASAPPPTPTPPVSRRRRCAPASAAATPWPWPTSTRARRSWTLAPAAGSTSCCSARRVAPGGTAYGLDASPDMLTLARANAAQAGVTNARFLHGHIEDIPLPDGQVDVVISNCVINLSADKPRVLAEAFRVLRPGGRLGISDVTADDGTEPGQLAGAEQRAGCGATITQAHYRDLLQAAGFTGIAITSTHEAGPGLHSAIIQAARPASRHT